MPERVGWKSFSNYCDGVQQMVFPSIASHSSTSEWGYVGFNKGFYSHGNKHSAIWLRSVVYNKTQGLK